MKYKPEVDMCILIKTPNQTSNVIGVISQITEGNITVARLDECGQLVININSDWEPLDVLDPHKLKHYYSLFIGKNVSNIFTNNYEQYKKNHIKN